MSARYARVQQKDGDSMVGSNTAGVALANTLVNEATSKRHASAAKIERRRKRAEKAEYYSTKMHAALWFVAACLAIYFTDFIKVCTKSTRVNRFWFNTAVLCFTIASILILYMAVWVPRVLKINYEPSVYSPRMLPITGGIAIASFVLFIVGLWPVYGFFTPGLLFLIFLGGLMSAHFLPGI